MDRLKVVFILLVIVWFIAFMGYPSASRILIIHEGIVSMAALFLGIIVNELQHRERNKEKEGKKCQKKMTQT